MTRDVALMIRDSLQECLGKLDHSVAIARDGADAEEYARYRRAVGQAMGAILNILEPLYLQHPDLDPLRKDGEVGPG